MKCTKCDKEIVKGQPYARTRNGVHHFECGIPRVSPGSASDNLIVMRRTYHQMPGQRDGMARINDEIPAKQIININETENAVGLVIFTVYYRG